ncbi:hypothetical protein CYMTET_49807 [Cymbomonas tetramitiformis]|uniref:Uncharacterized protein n=1 Tax=Cymbomonas tetramitiformis TaxID=36881 RepID=A0AAE0BPG6_9CHLO|nr:hypothetical protein CYMTET_49807 [Cymbomonas tetramitiformis]
MLAPRRFFPKVLSNNLIGQPMYPDGGAETPAQHFGDSKNSWGEPEAEVEAMCSYAAQRAYLLVCVIEPWVRRAKAVAQAPAPAGVAV